MIGCVCCGLMARLTGAGSGLEMVEFLTLHGLIGIIR